MKKVSLLILLITNIINAQNILQKADSLLYQGNYILALNTLNNAKSQTFDVFNKKGNIYKQTANYSKAIKEYTLALNIKIDEKTKENLGKCYQKTSNYKKAIRLFSEVLENNPNNLLLKYHLANLYKTKKQYNKAKSIYKELIKTDYFNANYHHQLGIMYLLTKQKDSSKMEFYNALKIDSTHFKSIYYLAKVHRKKYYNKYILKKYKFKNDTSYFYLNKGLTYYPNNKKLILLSAKYNFDDGNYQNTIDQLIKNIGTLEKEYEQLLSRAYYYTKDYEKAKDYLYNLIDNKERDSKDFYYLSMVYKAEKDYEKAEIYIKLSIQIEQPQLSPFYYELGLIYQEAKQLKKAIEAFQTALKENKNNHKAYFQLALTCDSFYSDKTIAIKYYKNYISKFSYKNDQTLLFSKQRVKELNKMIFMAK